LLFAGPDLALCQDDGYRFLKSNYQNSELKLRVGGIENGLHQNLFEACEMIGADRPNLGDIHYVDDVETFSSKSQIDAPDWYNAVAQHQLKQIVVWVKEGQSTLEVQNVVNHELMHWAIFSLPARASAQIPMWLHEGLAEMWSDRGYSSDYGVSLAWEAIGGYLPRLSSYENGFGNEPYRAAVGYALAKEFVVHLRNRFGASLFKKIFASMAEGRTFDQALIDHTGQSVVTHELAMRANLKSWWRVLQELYPHFFFLVVIIVLALVPFVKRRSKQRRALQHQKWQSEEQQVDIWQGTKENKEDEN
jgi:hypothetical protein